MTLLYDMIFTMIGQGLVRVQAVGLQDLPPMELSRPNTLMWLICLKVTKKLYVLILEEAFPQMTLNIRV